MPSPSDISSSEDNENFGHLLDFSDFYDDLNLPTSNNELESLDDKDLLKLHQLSNNQVIKF